MNVYDTWELIRSQSLLSEWFFTSKSFTASMSERVREDVIDWQLDELDDGEKQIMESSILEFVNEPIANILKQGADE